MISVNNKFLFIHIPKTAGNSIQAVLSKYSEDVLVRDDPDQDGINTFEVRNNNIPVTKHSPLKKYSKHINPIFFDSFFKFTCVRNPWDRLVSLYFTPKKNRSTWDRKEFINLIEETPTMVSYINVNGSLKIDYILRYESVDVDFSKLCKLLNIPEYKLPLRNKSIRDLYSKYYDDELIELVSCKFKEDIEIFKYNF